MDTQAVRDYKAQWIWAKLKLKEPFQFVRFRKNFRLDALPKRAVAYITADTFYRLRINGRLVMHGPARSSAGHITIDAVPITRYLRAGENTVLVEALHCSNVDEHFFEALAQAPGFFCELEIGSGREKCLITTDRTWEACEVTTWNRKANRFSYQRGWIEDIDSREESKLVWEPAVELDSAGIAPWKTIELRDIPLPAPLKEVKPVSIAGVQKSIQTASKTEPLDWVERLENERLQSDSTVVTNAEAMTVKGSGDTVIHGDDAGITFDFGKNYVGFIGFAVTGKPGQVLEFAWNERLSERDAVPRPRERLDSNQVLRYVLNDGMQVFLSFNPQLLRFLRVVHRGNGDVILHRVWITEYHFSAPAENAFVCSDSGINKIYRAAQRTAVLNTLDTFMDCPTRERGAWLHDSYWTAQAVYMMFNDLSVNRRMVRQGAESLGYLDPPGMIQCVYPSNWTRDKFIPGHALFWILQLGLDDRFSGDIAFVKTILPAMRQLLEAFEGWLNDVGLLENVPSWNFLDWADVRTDGVSVALNAVYATALDEAGRLEQAAGERTLAESYMHRAMQVREALRQFCGDELFYPDVLVRDEQKQLVCSTERSESTQYFIMWAGIPSQDRMERMWNALRDDFMPTPDQKVPLIHGLARAGLYSFPQRLLIAERLGDYTAFIRDLRAMFLPMAESVPGTLWEHPWSIASLCHGFASVSAAFFINGILGVQPGNPLVIAPHSGGMLKWCRGNIAAIQGSINVCWSLQEDRYELEVSLPEGITAEIILPQEAKDVWDSLPSERSWCERIPIKGTTELYIEPGKLDVREK